MIFQITSYSSQYALPLVKMWRESFEQALGVMDPHPLLEQLNYLHEVVVANNQVHIVLDPATNNVIGFLAANKNMVAQLYVHINYQGKGIGTQLIEIAKQNSDGRLRLFTFKSNIKAQRFYEHHGFKIIGQGFEEEWQLEDLEYEWVKNP